LVPAGGAASAAAAAQRLLLWTPLASGERAQGRVQRAARACGAARSSGHARRPRAAARRAGAGEARERTAEPARERTAEPARERTAEPARAAEQRGKEQRRPALYVLYVVGLGLGDKKDITVKAS
jgi:hypothetical protein